MSSIQDISSGLGSLDQSIPIPNGYANSRDLEHLSNVLRDLQQYLPQILTSMGRGIIIDSHTVRIIREPLVNEINLMRQTLRVQSETITILQEKIKELSGMYDEILFRAETGQLAIKELEQS